MVVKLRPYYKVFLAEMSKLFEIIVYTFGTRSYALEILKIMDPDQKYLNFSKLITRNESTKHYKELDKVLSLDCLDWVIILDDTKSVWNNFIGNLLHVKSFNFFEDGGHGGVLDKPLTIKKGEFYVKKKSFMTDIYLRYIQIYLKLLHEFFFRFETKISLPVS